MRHQQTDLWTTPCDAICITTNGTVKSNGCAVMGRGCAQQARDRYPALDDVVGYLLTHLGNHARFLDASSPLAELITTPLVMFPVKHHWHEHADLTLIERSARELMVIIEQRGWQTVLLPRPGCGNGQLTWAEVEPVIAPILDDRVVVVWL